jgi:hypothetical protein
MNKNQIISNGVKLLTDNGFTDKHYSTELKSLKVILTKLGNKKMTTEIAEKLLELRITVVAPDGEEVKPKVIQNVVESEVAKGKSNSVEDNGEFNVGAKREITLKNPLEVFSKKDVLGKAAKMGPATVILSKLPDTDGEGYNIIGVKKPGSSRIFYTTENRLPNLSNETLTEAKPAVAKEAAVA